MAYFKLAAVCVVCIDLHGIDKDDTFKGDTTQNEYGNGNNIANLRVCIR